MPAADRSLDHLVGFMRVIRIPRPDVDAMLALLPAGIDEALEATDPIAELLSPLGWLAFAGAPQEAYAEAAALAPTDAVAASTLLTDAWNDDPASLDELLHGTALLYAPSPAGPSLPGLRDGRLALLEETLACHAAGRYAAAIALAISQLDGIAADVPPTPGAAFPFLVAAPRDRTAADPLLDAAHLAAHPACAALVAQLMRTGRPDTNLTGAVHRHGVMHGRDLGYGTRERSTQVLTILLALVGWAIPIARGRLERAEA